MFKQTLFALALGAASLAAHAGLSIERTTTIRDDYNGRAVIESAATLGGDETGTRVSEATFTNFHPRDEHRFVDGEISREAVRDGELVTVTYDGELTLSNNAGGNNGNGNSQQLVISFVDLRIERGDESVDLAGTLVVNGRSIDAATAPAQVRAILLGLLRFFRA
jgi:hypothetical protein